jgi:hypothetical protein
MPTNPKILDDRSRARIMVLKGEMARAAIDESVSQPAPERA